MAQLVHHSVTKRNFQTNPLMTLIAISRSAIILTQKLNLIDSPLLEKEQNAWNSDPILCISEQAIIDQSKKKPALLISTKSIKVSNSFNPNSQPNATVCQNESIFNALMPFSSPSRNMNSAINGKYSDFHHSDDKNGNNQYQEQGDFSISHFQPDTCLPKPNSSVLDESKSFFMGKIKYFDFNKEFGFIHIDNDAKEIFFHLHDVNDSRLSKEVLNLSKIGISIRVMFKVMNYIGKYDTSRKAIGIRIWEVPNV